MLAAELDAEERAERQAKAEAWKQARKDMEALDAQFTAWWNASSTLIDAYLTAPATTDTTAVPGASELTPQKTASTPQQGEQGQ